jgi:hypothetical protein
MVKVGVAHGREAISARLEPDVLERAEVVRGRISVS